MYVGPHTLYVREYMYVLWHLPNYKLFNNPTGVTGRDNFAAGLSKPSLPGGGGSSHDRTAAHVRALTFSFF